jgi:SAM-dependent methyltransferase
LSQRPEGEDLAERYDAIAYAAQPSPWSHPSHIAAVATLYGLDAPPVARCRVLEVGCSNGANLIPMAVTLPEATFTGCDLAARPIDDATRAVDALGLTNIRFVQADLSALPADFGTYDYIVAHGVYSWVPAPVRDALFALAARHLAPTGVMFVSYNTFPGCHVRRAAWDMLHYHVDHIADPRAKMDAARALAAVLALPGGANEESDAAVRAELSRIATREDSPLFHDDLGTPNDPVYFHEFVAHAGRHGLAFIAESAVATMRGADLAPRVALLVAGYDRLQREQYLDFAHLRRYRQSLLTHANAAVDFAPSPSRLTDMHVSASTALIRAAAEGRLGSADVRDTKGALLRWLAELAPRAVSLADARAWLAARGAASVDSAIETLVADAFGAGLAQLHAAPLRVATVIGERPLASPLARRQALAGDHLTNLRHEGVRIADPVARQVLALLDGTRSRRSIAETQGAALAPRDRRALAEHIDEYLKAFAKLALLVAP